MDDSLWDTSETNPDTQRSLSELEQQFLLTGETGTYPNSTLVDQLRAKTKKLPNRIQQLIDDISLLYHSGYLVDGEDEIWNDLLSISNRSQVVRKSPVERTARQRSGPELDFGFEIGSIIRFLHDESVPAELVWGIIIGLVGESDRHWGREGENLVDLFGELEEYYETRLVSAGTEAHEDDGFQEERNIIREILREQGFAPAPPLVDAVLQEYTRDETVPQVEYTAKPSSTDSNPAAHPESPNDSPTPEAVRQTSLESVVSRLADQTQLRSIDRLGKDLREDVFLIQNDGLWGVDFDSILCYLGENGKTNINDFDEIEASRNSKTRVLNVSSSNHSSKVNRPVTRKDPAANWSLTAYGELVYETRIKYNCSTNWIYNLIADPKRLHNDNIFLISRVLEGGSEYRETGQ